MKYFSRLLILLPIFLWGGVNPAEGRVCFIVDADGSCNGGKVEKFKQDCSARGYTKICAEPQVGEGGSCVSGGKTYHKKCVCPSEYNLTKATIDGHELVGEFCEDDKGKHYKTQVCKAEYKYVQAQSGYINEIQTSEHKPYNRNVENCAVVAAKGNICLEDMASRKIGRYTKCECDKTKYPYTKADEKSGAIVVRGNTCQGADGVLRYSSLECTSEYAGGCSTGDDDYIIKEETSQGKTCRKCTLKTCSNYGEYRADGSRAVALFSCSDLGEGYKKQIDTYQNGALKCGKCVAKACVDWGYSSLLPIRCRGEYESVSEKFLIGDVEKTCYKCEPKKKTCLEYGGLTLAEKEAEPSEKTALYNYKSSSEAGISTGSLTCYFRFPKACSDMTYTTIGGNFKSATDTYLARPVAGVRVEGLTFRFPDAYSGATKDTYTGSNTQRVCFKKHSNCVPGDLLTSKGFCLPKSNSGSVWGWGDSHDFIRYGVDATSKLGMVTRVTETASDTSSSMSIRYVTLDKDEYYPYYKSTGDNIYQFILESAMAGKLNSNLKCYEKASCQSTPGGFRYARSVGNLWNTRDAEDLISHINEYKALGGNVYNRKSILSTNRYGNGKAESKIFAKECYYVIPTSDKDQNIRRVILDPASSGVVSSSNRNNPRFLYGRHAYAEGTIATEVIYGGGSDDRKLSKLTDFTPTWDRNAVVQPARIFRRLADKEYHACDYNGAKPENANGLMSNSVFDDVETISVYHCAFPMYFEARATCNKTHDANTGVPETNCWVAQISGHPGDGFTTTGLINYADNLDIQLSVPGSSEKVLLTRSGLQGCYVKKANSLARTVTRNKLKDFTSGGSPTVPGGSIPGGSIPGQAL